ncbi:MAG: MFS transporter [Campylobacterota bacterium]|nr:MFS transporter [Campylobacterota bacterium]
MINLDTKKKLYFAGLVGEIMEWFDFTVYGFFALIIASNFFPSENHFVSVIATFAAFAIGFLMRPLGGLFFGYIGDKYGRKKVLTTSMFLMAFPSLIIALTPTFATIGILAPIILILMRMLQGLSVGGEHTGAIIYLTELSSREDRALSAAIPFIGVILGVLLGSLVGVIIFSIFSYDTIVEWAWRIPFFLGVLVAVVGIIIRKYLPESHVADENEKDIIPIAEVFKHHLASFIKVFFLNLTFAVGFYTVFIYNPIWMQKFVHVSKSYSLEVNSISLVLAIGAIFVSSHYSNKVGRKPLLLLSTAGLTLFSYPLYELMLSDAVYHTLLGQGAFAILIGTFMGPIGVVMVELFKKSIRMSAVGVAFNLSFAIFGGTAPMIATWLIHTTHNNLSLAWYLSFSAFISFITVLTIDETYKKEHLD